MVESNGIKIRRVLCPKCRSVLDENPDIPVYMCGKCDAVLRAKHCKSGANSDYKAGANENARPREQENTSCMTNLPADSSQNGSSSSNGETMLVTQDCSPMENVSEVNNLKDYIPTFDDNTANSVMDNLSEAKNPCLDGGTTCNFIMDVVDNLRNKFVDVDDVAGSLERDSVKVKSQTVDVGPDQSEIYNPKDEVPNLDESSCGNSRQLSPEREIDSLQGNGEDVSLYESHTGNENASEMEDVKGEAPPANSGSSSCNSEQLSPNANGKIENDELSVGRTVLCDMLEESLNISRNSSLPVRSADENEDYLKSTHPNSRKDDTNDRQVGHGHGSPIRKPAVIHHAYDASISSFEDGFENRFSSRHQLKNKRTYRSQQSSEYSRLRELDETNNFHANVEDNKASFAWLPESAVPPRLLKQRYSSETVGSSYMSDRDELLIRTGVDPASEDFYSAQNWTETDNYNSSLKNLTGGSQFNTPDTDRMELLRKIDELRDQLARSHDRLDKRPPHFKGSNQSTSSGSASEQEMHRLPSIPSHLLDPYGSKTMLPGHQRPVLPASPRPDPSYFCLHCTSGHRLPANVQFPAATSCSNELCGSYCYICSQPGNLKCQLHSDPRYLPQNYSHDFGKMHHKSRDRSRKRHYRPVVGGANLIACYECLKVLQIPENFRFSRKRCNKLRCGACSKVLSLALVNRNQILPYSLAVQLQLAIGGVNNSSNFATPTGIHVPPMNHRFSQWGREQVSFSDTLGPSLGRHWEIEDDHVQYVSRDSTDSMIDRDIKKPPLHSLMGYISASEIIYKH